MNKEAYYEQEHDILLIHKGFPKDEKFKTNIDVGNLILDLSNKGRVRGIEILNASNFLKDFNIGREMLVGMTDADFNASSNPNGIIIGLVIKSKTASQALPVKIAVPLASVN